MDCRNSFGASGKGPSMAWLPTTMNSASPVTPLDARRMCSRSERFIFPQDAEALLLRHDDSEGTVLPHPAALLRPVAQGFQNASEAAGFDQIQPFSKIVFGLDGVIRL